MNTYNSNSYPAITESDKHWAAATHWGGMVLALMTSWMVGAGGFTVPLIIQILRGRDNAFVAQHAKEAMNFNLSMFIYAVIGVILTVILGGATVLTLGFAALITLPSFFIMLVAFCILAVAWVLCSILGTIAAYDGKAYRYPFTIRLIR